MCIKGVIKDLKDNFSEGDILIVNDGSLDNTSQVVKSIGTSIIDLPCNLGIGGAMQTGFLYGIEKGYDAAIQFDGDGQHRADEIIKLLDPYQLNGTDLVVGSRFLSKNGYRSSILRVIGGKFFSFAVSVIMRRKITDTTSGFRLYSKNAMKQFAISYPEDYPEVESLIVAHKKGLIIKEVPSQMKPRIMGRSSITRMRAVYYMVKVLLAIFIDLIKRVN